MTANMGTGGHNVPIILTDFGIRKLTPRETFNVMGFPRLFVLPSNVSRGQLYKQAGNSVVVPVIRRIAQNIASALRDIKNEVTSGRHILLNNAIYILNISKHTVN